MLVIRSPWDYTARRDEFLGWARRASLSGRRLHNDAGLIGWNSDKRYLQDLLDAGLPIVPSTWSEPGTEVDWPEVEFVAKPTVGAGSLGAGRFDPASAASLEAARDHVAMLHRAGRTVLLQPYLSGVDVAGERALVYFGGRFSHAITKAALLPPQTAFGLREVSSAAPTIRFSSPNASSRPRPPHRSGRSATRC